MEPWTENVHMYTETSTYLPVLTSAAVAATLSQKCGGPTNAWMTIATSIVAAFYTSSQDNVYLIPLRKP